MLPWFFLSQPLNHPHKSLSTVFIAWKFLLLVIAGASPGHGYDTSTALVQPYNVTTDRKHVVSLLRFLSSKLTRWDAIYFTKIASRGYLYEQEWAFGWGITLPIKLFACGLKAVGFGKYEFLESFVGIGLAHVAHGLSVLALYSLTEAIFHSEKDKRLAFVTACLHVFSPAGLFLSAPYGESTFALLSFVGYLMFVKSFKPRGQSTAYQDALMVVSGLALGCATTIRSNGLLNGSLFLVEALKTIYLLRSSLALPLLRRLITIVIGGLFIAIGFLVPQFIGYREFCGNHISDGHSQRAWCSNTFPSIFGFVQSHYWNVGFLRYWTLSNIPLFILAFPMLTILTISSIWTLQARGANNMSYKLFKAPILRLETLKGHMLRNLAVPQVVLAILALTSYHVQIITRISSGYCIWYIWLASAILASADEIMQQKVNKSNSWELIGSKEIVRYMIVYAAIQAVLFSSFLPPA